MSIWLIVAIIIFVALCGAPLFTIFGALALYLFYASGIDVSAVIIELYRLTDMPPLVAIPLFTFAGYMLAESKAPRRLVNLAQALFGWIPGGLAIVVLITCAFFTAFTGASGVTIVALGGLFGGAMTVIGIVFVSLKFIPRSLLPRSSTVTLSRSTPEKLGELRYLKPAMSAPRPDRR